MMRGFCLWQKRCACGTMCAFGTFWIAGRVRKRSVYAQQPRIRANALHLTLCVRLLAMSAAFDFRKCKRLLLSSLAVSLRVRPPVYKNNRGCGCFLVYPGGVGRSKATKSRNEDACIESEAPAGGFDCEAVCVFV